MLQLLNDVEVFRSLDPAFFNHAIGHDEMMETKLGGILSPVQADSLRQGHLVVILSEEDLAVATVVALFQVQDNFPILFFLCLERITVRGQRSWQRRCSFQKVCVFSHLTE